MFLGSNLPINNIMEFRPTLSQTYDAIHTYLAQSESPVRVDVVHIDDGGKVTLCSFRDALKGWKRCVLCVCVCVCGSVCAEINHAIHTYLTQSGSPVRVDVVMGAR